METPERLHRAELDLVQVLGEANNQLARLAELRALAIETLQRPELWEASDAPQRRANVQRILTSLAQVFVEIDQGEQRMDDVRSTGEALLKQRAEEAGISLEELWRATE